MVATLIQMLNAA